MNDQYADRHEVRYPSPQICTREQDRRHVRPLREAGRRAHGISGGACSERSRHRHGRHSECGGCYRVPDGRSNSRLRWNGEFPQSLHHRRGCGWHRGLYARSRHGRCKGDFPRRVRSLQRLEMM